MVKPSAKLEEVYQKYADNDGFLYLVYAEENIYGWKYLKVNADCCKAARELSLINCENIWGSS